MNIPTTEEFENQILEQEHPDLDSLDISFFNKRNNKTTKLINNSDVRINQKGQNREYEFTLKEPVYVEEISISTDGYATYSETEVYYTNEIKEKIKSENIKINNDYFYIKIGRIINGFSFKPEKKYFGNPTIKSIEVNGFSVDDFKKMCDYILDLENYKDTIRHKYEQSEKQYNLNLDEAKKLETIKIGINNDISIAEEESSKLENKINSLNKELNGIETSILDKKNEESATLSRIESLEDSIDKKKNEQKHLNTSISEKNSELKSLQDNINIFPSEISGFVSQGASNVKKYIFLAMIPIIILLAITVSLFFNAADLTTLYKTEEDLHLLTVLLTRLPYVVIAITLIHACYKLARIFIAEIMRINQQRLNLSKISIIATDVYSASTDGLNFDDDKIYYLRTKLKMELLREHLKEYISSNYEYKDNIPKKKDEVVNEEKPVPMKEEDQQEVSN